jgi:hypothetical protein
MKPIGLSLLCASYPLLIDGRALERHHRDRAPSGQWTKGAHAASLAVLVGVALPSPPVPSAGKGVALPVLLVNPRSGEHS